MFAILPRIFKKGRPKKSKDSFINNLKYDTGNKFGMQISVFEDIINLFIYSFPMLEWRDGARAAAHFWK